MPLFDYYHEALDGFDKYYKSDLRPKLAREDARYDWRNPSEFRWLFFGLLILGVAGVCGFSVLADKSVWFIVCIPISIGLSLFAISKLISVSSQEPPHDIIWQGIAAYIGLEFKENEEPPLSLWKDLGIVTTAEHLFDYERFIGGKYKNKNLFFVRAKYEFSGVIGEEKQVLYQDLMGIRLPRTHSGITIIVPEGHKSFFTQQRVLPDGSILKRIGLVDPIFERHLEVYGSDQVESRKLLDPNVKERLVQLERAYRNREFIIAIYEDYLLMVLTIPLRDKYFLRSFSLAKPAHTQYVLDEFDFLLHFIDDVSRVFQI